MLVKRVPLLGLFTILAWIVALKRNVKKELTASGHKLYTNNNNYKNGEAWLSMFKM